MICEIMAHFKVSVGVKTLLTTPGVILSASELKS